MRDAFLALAAHLDTLLQPGERYTAWLSAETSDFVRFNHGQIRQAGTVEQAFLKLRLVQGQRHVAVTTALTGVLADDQTAVTAHIATLRAQLLDVADDPHLLLADDAGQSTHVETAALDSVAMVADITRLSAGLDVVGYLASGQIAAGFASESGARLWHETTSFQFNWSVYAHGDKAVKCAYAGQTWDPAVLAQKLAEAKTGLAVLALPPKTLAPGNYRVYLTPTALAELLSMLNWGGFSEKQLRVKRSPLHKLYDGTAQFSPLLTVREHTAGGLAPAFQADGFRKPDVVPLIEAGRAAGSLVAPRTAKEYGLAANADAGEATESMDVPAGTLPEAEVLARLGTGLWISNLWYLNFSDRMNARVTGMTRFATFWVENGQIVAPVNVMRFDDSLFRVLGDHLEALTVEREWLVDADTYSNRKTSTTRLPGALIGSLALVL